MCLKFFIIKKVFKCLFGEKKLFVFYLYSVKEIRYDLRLIKGKRKEKFGFFFFGGFVFE